MPSDLTKSNELKPDHGRVVANIKTKNLETSKSLSTQKLNILLVDDEPQIRMLFQQKLRSLGHNVDEATDISSLMTKVKSRFFDAILLDNWLGSHRALDHIVDLVKITPLTKVIVLSAHGSIETAVQAMKKGAAGFLVKSDLLTDNIEKFFEIVVRHHEEVDAQVFAKFGIIGQGLAIKKTLSLVAKVAPTDVTVLIEGESGTGKELIARAIHDMSDRRDQGPFIAVNCAAISESLLESELFGSKRGSYTGSIKDQKGYFESCDKGTLFLDEIGDMSPSLQAKLLRVLQEGEITPVGSCQARKVDTRIIAATNRQLQKDTEQGRFRQDLYYRISVVKLTLPPLSERSEDLLPLIHHFIADANTRYTKDVAYPNTQLLAKLRSYDWPGNIRELKNAVERAVLLSDGHEMQAEDLIPISTRSSQMNQEDYFPSWPLCYSDAKNNFERQYIESLLKATGGNIAEAARVSGQYRPAIYRLLKKFDLAPQDFK
jgi:DNA-binding NtrC family response regulator